jgi:hypothetical protein
VRARNANQGMGHVVKDEFGVDRTQSNKIKVWIRAWVGLDKPE